MAGLRNLIIEYVNFFAPRSKFFWNFPRSHLRGMSEISPQNIKRAQNTPKHEWYKVLGTFLKIFSPPTPRWRLTIVSWTYLPPPPEHIKFCRPTPLGKPHYSWVWVWGCGKVQGESKIRRPAKRGGANFRRFPKEGTKCFGLSPKGRGRKQFHVFGVFGALFIFFGLRGVKNFRRVTKGGEKLYPDGGSFQIP